MTIKGIIHVVDLKHKLIGIRQYRKIKYFYFNNSQMNIFKRYLYIGNVIELDYQEDSLKIKNKIACYIVSYVDRLYAVGVKKTIYYDKSFLNKSLTSFLKTLGNYMVLDLEMTMPGFGTKGKSFRAELIQAGFILVDASGDEILRYNKYVKPTIAKTINGRAEKFLGIKKEDFDLKSISYNEFYDDFKEIYENYNPAVIIFGKNDSLVLNDSFVINEKENLNIRYVNICSLIKGYYELKNDPGLFRLYQTYYDVDENQLHDALDDAEVTLSVYKAFLDEVNHKINKVREIRNKFE